MKVVRMNLDRLPQGGPLSIATSGESVEPDQRRIDLRRQLRAIESYRPKALRTLPYNDPLGPTGNPKTFGACGGGNRSGGAAPGRQAWAALRGNGRLPSAFWDAGRADQDRQFDNLARQRSRIKVNGGKRKPPHRPRKVTSEQEQRVRDLLAAGIGINKAAKIVGIGVSAVQRIKREMT